MYSLSMLRTIKSTLPEYTLVFIKKMQGLTYLSFIKKNLNNTFNCIKIKLYSGDSLRYSLYCIGFTESMYDVELKNLRNYLNLLGSCVSRDKDVNPIYDVYYLYRAGAPCVTRSSTIFNRYIKRVNRHTNTNKDTTA